jgi:WD40 repeat protein
MSEQSQPPQPVYVFRGHASQVHGVKFWRKNTRLLTGDSNGWVVLWDVASRRPAAVWQAHSASILGIEVWGDDKVLTYVVDWRILHL